MQCPIDQTTLAMTERQGVEIDYCPKCRGVWLDRGELDKLIAAGSPSDPVSRDEPRYSRPEETRQPKYDDRQYRDDGYYKKKKKDSFLKDLFDF